MVAVIAAGVVAAASAWALLQATVDRAGGSSVELPLLVEVLSLEVAAGDVAIRAARDGARLDARSRGILAPSRRLARAGARVEARYGCRLWTSCRVDVTARLPAGADVDARTAFGDVTAEGLHGDLRLRTRAGEVGGAGLGSGAVKVEAGSGEVRLAFARPPREVEVETSSGDVEVRLPPGACRLALDSAAGDVRREGAPPAPAGAPVRVDTDSGDVRVVVAAP